MGEATLMFTGIVTDVGTVGRVSPLPEGVRLRIETAYDPATIDIGASISCAGVCLTVVTLPEGGSNARAGSRSSLGGGAAADHCRGLGSRNASIWSA
jgi:hypothetical protein